MASQPWTKQVLAAVVLVAFAALPKAIPVAVHPLHFSDWSAGQRIRHGCKGQQQGLLIIHHPVSTPSQQRCRGQFETVKTVSL